MATPYIRQTVKRTDIDLELLCSTLQNRTEVFSDIPEQVDFIDAMPEYDMEMYRHKKMKTTPETALEALKAALPVSGRRFGLECRADSCGTLCKDRRPWCEKRLDAVADPHGSFWQTVYNRAAV